jgi:hypothetical protein
MAEIVEVKKPRRPPTAYSETQVKKFKRLFLDELDAGLSPGAACRKLNLSRSAAYHWRKDDPEFKEEWENAVETCLDMVESRLYKSALEGNDMLAMYTLNNRRYNQQINRPPPPSNYTLNITLAEHEKRLERLGLPAPMIESDVEEDDVTDISDSPNS